MTELTHSHVCPKDTPAKSLPQVPLHLSNIGLLTLHQRRDSFQAMRKATKVFAGSRSAQSVVSATKNIRVIT